MELLEYLDKKYLVYNNIVFLQGLFLECKVPILYDQCVEYAKTRGEEICFFEKKILQSGKKIKKKRLHEYNEFLFFH